MPDFLAKAALLPQGWTDNVLISVDAAGIITGIGAGHDASAAQILDGPVLPGMPNLHSHAFQYAMAGLAEHSTDPANSFWSWRKAMYGFLETFGPDELEGIATSLYQNMLRAGYTQVAEFHYLHHQPGGRPYDDRACLARCMVRAARKAGIGITLLPVLYAHAGFGGQVPEGAQRRFINSADQMIDMVSSLYQEFEADPDVRIGLALHSLRAVSPDMIAEAVSAVHRIDPHMPIHIHAAEQTKEVEDCQAWCGQRPVEWLLDHCEIDSRWCLIHATHMTEDETRALARSGAVAGLCPTTEANLGDGLFNLPSYLRHGGQFGIGSDSHISVNMIEELRWLEYGQRLTQRQRLVARSESGGHTGAFLYQAALAGGAQALGTRSGQIAVGCRADFLVLDGENPALRDKAGDFIQDAMIFATNSTPVKDVYTGGCAVVRDFRAVSYVSD